MIHELFTYLRVRDAARAIEFYESAFGATEKYRLNEPGTGRIGHAELLFGGTTLMLSDEYPEYGILGPQSIGGTSLTIHLHVDDCDASIRRAAAAGATVLRAPSDAFYGERSGTVRDPFGHEWNLGHEIEQVEPAEMQRRYDRLPPSETSACEGKATGFRREVAQVHARAHVHRGFGAVRPYLHGPSDLPTFLQRTFAALELERNEGGPTLLQIGDAFVWVEAGDLPAQVEPWVGSVYVYVEDVDTVYRRALELGARGIAAPEDKPYGERQAGFVDPGGNTWWCSTYGPT